MTNKATIFACFGYFLGHLQPRLIEAREAKVVRVIWLQVLLGIYLLEVFLFEISL